MQRRLNRYEYENALRDLLNVPWAQVKDKLPLDGEAYRFNKSGEALDVSFVQMERYLTAADYAMRQAMSAAFERPETTVRKIYARDAIGARYLAARERHAARPARVSRARFARAARGARRTRAQHQPGDARTRGRGQGLQHLQRCRRLQLGLQRAGRRALPHSAEGLLGLGERRRNRPLVLRRPGRGESAGLLAACLAPAQRRRNLAAAATTSPSASTRRARARRGRSASWTSRRSRPSARSRCNSRAARASAPTRCGFSARASTAPTSSTSIRWRPRRACPATRCNGWKSKGRWRTNATSGYKLLFGDLPMRRLGAGEKGGVPLEIRGAVAAVHRRWSRRALQPWRRWAGRIRARSPISNVTVEVISETPQQDAERLLRNFMQVAYRRPVEEPDVQRFLGLFRAGVRARLRLRAFDAHRLHRRAGLAGLRVRRGAAGQARRLGAGHAPVALPLELHARRRAARARRQG